MFSHYGLLTLVYLLFTAHINAQKFNYNNQTLQELLIASANKDSIALDILIKKAKKEKNFVYLNDAYHIKMFYGDIPTQLAYADSIIKSRLYFENKIHPSGAYLTKARIQYNLKDFQNAIDNYILAHSYATANTNEVDIFLSNRGLGLAQTQIGNLNTAIDLYRKNLKYLEETDPVNKIHYQSDYLATVFELANTYADIHKPDSADYYNRKGIHASLRRNDDFYYYSFVLNTGIVHRQKALYQQAIDSLIKAESFFRIQNDLPKLGIIYYYMGDTFLAAKKEKQGVQFLKKTDSIFELTEDIRIKIHETYQKLITHFKNKEDANNRLYYTDKLIALKELINKENNYITNKLAFDYKIPQLKADKEKLQQLLYRRKQTSQILSYSLIITIFLGLIFFTYQYRKRKRYKKRLDELIQKDRKALPTSTSKMIIEQAVKTLNLSPDIIAAIEEGLHSFEQKKAFTDTSLSINSLSKTLNTNPNYLSKFINRTKNMSFTHYVNNLRIAYCVSKLKEDPTYKKYTIEAIAHEFGFKTGGAFSRSFERNTGIKPSYFIKNLPNPTEDSNNYKSAG